MTNSLVSIILPTYNGSKYISKIIDSVLSQTNKNFELIIINDASTDNVESIILDYKKKDDRIIYIKNDKNLERSKSKNKGVNMSEGKYIAFIDDDDEWYDKNKLKKQVDFLNNNNEYGLIGTNAIAIDEKLNEVGKIIVKSTDKKIKNNLLITNQFIQSSILIKKDIFIEAGGFNENMNLCEDYDLWLRVGKITKVSNLKDFSIKYLIRTNSTTGQNYNKMKNISIKLILKYKNYYPNYHISIIIRFITYFIPINIITKIVKKIEQIKSIYK